MVVHENIVHQRHVFGWLRHDVDVIQVAGFTPEVAASLGVAITLAIIIPLFGYFILKKMLTSFDAAAVAATYGSVSAVTFVTAVQYLDTHSISYGGYMAAAMALMESPAIIWRCCWPIV